LGRPRIRMKPDAPSTPMWGRGWLIGVRSVDLRLAPFPERDAAGVETSLTGDFKPGLRYDLRGTFDGQVLTVTQLLPSHAQSELSPRELPGLVAHPRPLFREVLEDLESQPWFNELSLGMMTDWDSSSRQPHGAALFLRYVTREVRVWAQGKPKGMFRIYPLISRHRHLLAP